MRIDLTEEQRMIESTARDVATRELRPAAAAADAAGALPASALARMGELGLMGILAPESAGGVALDLLTLTVAVEELATGCASTAAAVALHNVAVATMVRAGWSGPLDTLATGAARATLPLPDRGNGPASPERDARGWRSAGNYVLAGRSGTMPALAGASWALLPLPLDPGADEPPGVEVLAVALDARGVTIEPVERPLGLRASGMGSARFDDARPSPTARLGAGGAGWRIAGETQAAARVAAGALLVGCARAALESAVAYVRDRRQFGRPLADFQAIQWMVAESATAIDTARLLVRRAARSWDAGEPVAAARAAQAAHVAAEASRDTTGRAIQAHGGYGYLVDFPVERHYRDAAAIAALLGGRRELLLAASASLD